MEKWTISDDAVEIEDDCDSFTAKIDFAVACEGNDAHWSKIEVHDMDAQEALRLADIIVIALNNERETIANDH